MDAVKVTTDLKALDELEKSLAKLPSEMLRDVAVEGVTEAVIQASEMDQAEYVAKLEAAFSNGRQAQIRLSEDGVVRQMRDMPTAILIAQKLAQDTGRAPVIRMQRSASDQMQNTIRGFMTGLMGEEEE